MVNPATGKKWKVYCGFPSNGNVIDYQSYVMRELQDRYSEEVDLVFPEILTQRIFHDYARNGIVQEFLASDCDVLWQLDSDVCPPRHVLDLLTMHGDKWEIAGAPYPIFMTVPGESYRQIVITAYKGTENGGLRPVKVPDSGTEFIDGLATGCLFIKREVFAKLQPPYFEHKFHEKTRQMIEGEDLGFAMKVGKLGIKFFTDYSMICKHEKKACLLEVNNYALTFAQKAIKSYHHEVLNSLEKGLSEKLGPKAAAKMKDALEKFMAV